MCTVCTLGTYRQTGMASNENNENGNGNGNRNGNGNGNRNGNRNGNGNEIGRTSDTASFALRASKSL